MSRLFKCDDETCSTVINSWSPDANVYGGCQACGIDKTVAFTNPDSPAKQTKPCCASPYEVMPAHRGVMMHCYSGTCIETKGLPGGMNAYDERLNPRQLEDLFLYAVEAKKKGFPYGSHALWISPSAPHANLNTKYDQTWWTKDEQTGDCTHRTSSGPPDYGLTWKGEKRYFKTEPECQGAHPGSTYSCQNGQCLPDSGTGDADPSKCSPDPNYCCKHGTGSIVHCATCQTSDRVGVAPEATQALHCDTCDKGFTLKGNLCKSNSGTCKPTIDGCGTDNCKQASLQHGSCVCTQCDDHLGLVGGKCTCDPTAWNMPHCAVATSSDGKTCVCTKCKTGWTLEGNQCTKNQPPPGKCTVKAAAGHAYFCSKQGAHPPVDADTQVENMLHPIVYVEPEEESSGELVIGIGDKNHPKQFKQLCTLELTSGTASGKVINTLSSVTVVSVPYKSHWTINGQTLDHMQVTSCLNCLDPSGPAPPPPHTCQVSDVPSEYQANCTSAKLNSDNVCKCSGCDTGCTPGSAGGGQMQCKCAAPPPPSDCTVTADSGHAFYCSNNACRPVKPGMSPSPKTIVYVDETAKGLAEDKYVQSGCKFKSGDLKFANVRVVKVPWHSTWTTATDLPQKIRQEPQKADSCMSCMTPNDGDKPDELEL